MKLKSATLIALIATILIIVISAINTFLQFSSIEYSDSLMMWYRISGIISLISWCGIANFFITLFKNQK